MRSLMRHIFDLKISYKGYKYKAGWMEYASNASFGRFNNTCRFSSRYAAPP